MNIFRYKLIWPSSVSRFFLLIILNVVGINTYGCAPPATVNTPSSPKTPSLDQQTAISEPELLPLLPTTSYEASQPARPNSQTPHRSAPVSESTNKPSSYQAQQVTALTLPPKPAQASPRVPIRVAIAQQSPHLVIGTSTAATVVDQQGQAIKTLVPSAAENFMVQSGQLRIGTHQAPNVVWIKPESSTGLTYVSGRWYRGAVQVIARNGKLTGVNHIDMESYLYSVVGSEMPASWPLEALKSQAIAARSYALVHVARPANPLFDLGDTQRWQAYKGVETETGSTLAAVEETAGLVLSHNGAVVESLYAASDQIVRDVHKGFGMSQNGANQLAQQQLNYQQILAHFYPGTRLAWLQFSS